MKIDTEEGLAALEAAIDAGDISDLILDLPRGVRWKVLMAARAAKSAREILVEALSYACSGDYEEAVRQGGNAVGALATMHEELAAARDLNTARGGRT